MRLTRRSITRQPTHAVGDDVRQKAVREEHRIRTRTLRDSIRLHDSHHAGDDRFTVPREVGGRLAGVETVSEILVELCEERMDHRESDTVDRPFTVSGLAASAPDVSR